MIDAETLRATWGRVVVHGDAVASDFYARLFLIAPGIRSLFPVAMDHQRDRLVGALGHAVTNVDDLDSLVPFLQALGRDHRKFGAVREHYKVVGMALLGTLQHFLADRWTTDVEAAWTAAYEVIADVMASAAEAADTAGVPAFWDATVHSHQLVTPDLAVVTVQVDNADHPVPFWPGQSLSVQTRLRPHVWRQLTPTRTGTPDGQLTFHVRAVRGGEVSSALVHRLRPGDPVRLAAPSGTAYVPPEPLEQPLLMIAGGTGAAPFYAVTDHLVLAGNRAAATLVHGVRTARERDAYPLGHLTWALDNCRDWFRLFRVPAAGAGPGEPAGDPVDFAIANINRLPEHLVMVSGPPAMLDSAVNRLVRAGVPAPAIRVEAPADPRTYRPSTDPREARVR